MRFFSLALLSLFALTSCMKKPDFAVDPGPEFSIEQINQAAERDMPALPETVLKGQVVSLDAYQVIDTLSPVTIWQRSDLVTDQSEDSDKFHWSFQVDMREKDAGTNEWKLSQQNYGPMCIEKIEHACDTQTESTKAAEPSRPIRPYTLQGMKALDAENPYKVTYHKLVREDGFLPVPQAVANRPNCGGVVNCAQGLRYVRISFDRYIWVSEENPTRTSFRFTYSSDIPVYINDWDLLALGEASLTNQVDFCAQTWVTVTNNGQTQIVPVRECMEVTDFQFGSK
jgi:hypothetical protein